MTYEAWRISYQDSEKAARAAWNECQRLKEELAKEMIRSERMRWMLVEPGYYTEEEMQRAGL